MDKKIQGKKILESALLNKGTAFTQKERDELGLNGLLPIQVSSVEDQIRRTYLNFTQKRSALEKYDALIGLLSRNERLFYQFAIRYATEVLPIIYTPTVGEAAVEYSRIFFHERGLYLSYPLENQLDEIIAKYPQKDVEVIVVTDGERILGLGDLGVGGMTIPIGKLSLYTLFGGIHPEKTLPIILDVGTNNENLLKDDLYLGWKQRRLTSEKYDKFVDKFMKAIHKHYPNTLLQWEDFGKNNARRLLDKYKKFHLSFNDDIQGTASVAFGALLSALKVTEQKLVDQKIVILGGGSAGTGIADMIVDAIVEEGLAKNEALEKIYLIDIDGLIHFNTQEVTEAQKPYIQSRENLKDWTLVHNKITLLDVVQNVHPTVLIGVSAQGGAFTKEVIEGMAKFVAQPIIFPLSNPTSKAECTAEEAILWTQGRAVVATGSPFPPVEFQDKKYTIAQCNNVYIFPGLGLGALAVKAEYITTGMFLEAARTLAEFSPALNDLNGALLPEIDQVRDVSREIAIRVAKKACQEGVSKCLEQDIEKLIKSHIWTPSY